MPSILANLDHRHSYVRRNAVLAINALYKLPKGELMLADAPELIERFLSTEQDMSAKRNAFAMLTAHAQDRALRYLFEHLDSVPMWGDILQMAVLELIRKVCVLGRRPQAAAAAQKGGQHSLHHTNQWQPMQASLTNTMQLALAAVQRMCYAWHMMCPATDGSHQNQPQNLQVWCPQVQWTCIASTPAGLCGAGAPAGPAATPAASTSLSPPKDDQLGSSTAASNVSRWPQPGVCVQP